MNNTKVNKSNPFLDGFRTFLKVVIIIVLIIFALLLLFGVWTIQGVLINVLKFLLLIGLSGAFIVYIYYAFLERFLAERNRERTAEVCHEDYGLTNQVSGKPRSGKDSSTIAESRLINEIELEKDLEELEQLEKILYIYDFDKIKDYIDKNGKSLLVSGKNRLFRKYVLMMHYNKCFLKDYYIDGKLIDPRKHLDELKNKKGNFVFEYNMNDGITPGGVPFQDLLLKYIILYTYRIFITNYIMSNQPILEKFDIEDSGKINFSFSKRFSQRYIRIKEDNPIPLPLRGCIIETEMAIMLSNVDSATQAQAKMLNGIREFYTVIGHILGERIYMFAIVQDPRRQVKFVRELYQIYIHVFKQETVATASMRRKLLDFYKAGQSVSLWIYKKLQVLTRKKSRIRRVYMRLIEKTSKRIASIYMHQIRLFNNGYLVTYKGVYSSAEDVGKKVRFPRFGVKIEAINEQIIYPAFGFRSFVRISDAWGRYNTHFIHFIRDSKEERHKMHFNDVENWTSFEPNDYEVKDIDYQPLTDIVENIVEGGIEKLTDNDKETKETKRTKSKPLPIFENLTQQELVYNCEDYGYHIITWSETIGRIYYKHIIETADYIIQDPINLDFSPNNFLEMDREDIESIVKVLNETYPEVKAEQYAAWRTGIIDLLKNEWKTAFTAK